jgi:hypothetical protein
MKKAKIIEELQCKFNIGEERLVRACLMLVNEHSGTKFDGLTEEAKTVQNYINDFMALYVEKQVCVICGGEIASADAVDSLAKIGITGLQSDTPLCHEHYTQENITKIMEGEL